MSTLAMEDLGQTPMELALKRSLLPKNKLAVILTGENGPLYCCVECPAKYPDKDKLEIHLCSQHQKEYRFLCGICGTGLKRKEHLDRHLLGHQEVRPHVCDDCGKGFKRKEHLNIHRSIHSGDKTQICPLCQRSFYRKDHLQKHLQTHSKGGDISFQEVKMEPDDQDLGQMEHDEVSTKMDMDMASGHLKVDPARPYACSVCLKTYKRKDHLKLHSYTHMEKDKVCSECGRAFHKEEQLLAHMSVHLEQKLIGRVHDSDEGPLTPAQDLLVPRSVAEVRPHGCEVCGRRFKRRQHLKVHANVHRPSPTIWCSLCSEGFQSNTQFEQHECLVQSANGDEGYSFDNQPENYYANGSKQESPEAYYSGTKQEPPEAYYSGTKDSEAYYSGTKEMPGVYGNDDVKEAYVYSNGPKQEAEATQQSPDVDYENDCPDPEQYEEMMSVENLTLSPAAAPAADRPIPTPQRVYVCKYCGKPFKRKDHYKIHLHIHTGLKTFFCPDCGKGFYRKDHLQKHSLVHARARAKPPAPRKELPALYPIGMLGKRVKPEITITAPLNTKLRLPLQIKVPYQMVTATGDGEHRAVTITPQ